MPSSNDSFRIEVVAFDAVGTLIFPDPPVDEIYRRIGNRHGSNLSPDEVARRYRQAFRAAEDADCRKPEEWSRPDRLQTSEEIEIARWRTIVTQVFGDVPDPEACFRELFDHFARPQAWRCYPDVAETLSHLRDVAGARLALASNFDSRLLEIWRNLPELEPIEHCAVSSQIGYRKPSAHFYARLAEMVGASPENILMVGDDILNDIDGARLAGLRTVHLHRMMEEGGAQSNAAADVAVDSLARLIPLLAPA